MRPYILTICVLLLCGAYSFVSADELPPVPSIGCPIIAAKDAPKIDGTMDEPTWAKAEVQTKYQKVYAGGDKKLDFRIMTDGEWLYLGVTASQPGIPEGDEEYVDFVIAPDKASDQYSYFVVSMNAQGVKKRQFEKFRGTDGDWKSAFKFHEESYTLEMAVRCAPLFGGSLTKGKAFDFNLSRARITVLGDKMQIYQMWSHTGESSGNRYRFGEITVGNVADQLPVLRKEMTTELETARANLKNPSDEVSKAFAKAEEQGTALLFITHDLGVVRQVTSRVVVLYRGSIVEQGATDEVLDDHAQE